MQVRARARYQETGRRSEPRQPPCLTEGMLGMSENVSCQFRSMNAPAAGHLAAGCSHHALAASSRWAASGQGSPSSPRAQKLPLRRRVSRLMHDLSSHAYSRELVAGTRMPPSYSGHGCGSARKFENKRHSFLQQVLTEATPAIPCKHR